MTAGFTLLEMIVVLAILGLATALVAPAALRSIDSWRRQAAIDALLDQIRGLPGEARAIGKAITISDSTLASDKSPLRVEDDWRLRVPKAWRVAANGVCESGEVVVANARGERTLRIAAPFCDADVLP